MSEAKKNLTEAVFIKRLNRFVSIVKMDKKDIRVYVPNTGRLSELAIPGNRVLLVKSPGKYHYKIKYIYYNDFPVMIDSTHSNKLFGTLLNENRVKEFRNYTLLQTEPRYGNHRFDFLLKDTSGSNVPVELKSCTLAYNGIASFPDAVSKRASSHVKALAETGSGVLVFFILHDKIKYFVPNYHTDFEFYRTLRDNKKRIRLLAFSVRYDDDMNIKNLKSVPVKIPEVKPHGSYLFVLHCSREKNIDIGKLGEIKFKKGYYVYTGSGMNNVFKRISRHRQKGTKKHWHIDYIKDKMKIITDVPIVKNSNIECELARELKKLNGILVAGFGSSDCGCPGHLYYFRDNPVERKDFWDIVLKKRWG